MDDEITDLTEGVKELSHDAVGEGDEMEAENEEKDELTLLAEQRADEIEETYPATIQRYHSK